MTDACTKTCRFRSAGRSQHQLPRTALYLGQVARSVAADVANGTITSAAQQRYVEEASVAAGMCTSRLTCSRPSAAVRGALDETGLAGCCCSHRFVARDGMVAMHTPEQHAYHIRTCSSVVQRRPDICVAYADIGCRLERALREALRNAEAAGDLFAGVAEKVRGCGGG